MKIKLSKPVYFKAGIETKIGTVVEADKKEAVRLIALEAATPVDEKEPVVEDVTEAKVDTKELLEVKGITKKNIEALVAAGFNTIKSLQGATAEQLTQIKGISKTTAETIKKDAADFEVED